MKLFRQYSSIILAILLLIWAGGVTSCETNDMQGNKFDREKWDAGKGDDTTENPRAGMVSGLLNEVLKNGMSKSAVHDLLGEPDIAYDNIEKYALGRSPFGIDLEYLLLEFDGENLKSSRIDRS